MATSKLLPICSIQGRCTVEAIHSRFAIASLFAHKLIYLNIFSYFQCGVSNFLLGRYDMSLRDFEDAFLYLRGNQAM